MALARTPGEKKARERTKTERTTALRAGRHTNTMADAAAVSPDKPLTEQQKAFVRFWAGGESIPNAYARAGYSICDVSYAYRMSKMPNILAVYREEKRLLEEAAQMTRKKVMDGLLEAVEMAKLMAEPATMVSGWREIGKMCGYYEPKKVQVDVNVTGNVIHQRLNSLSDADLLRLIQEGGATPLLEAGDDGEDDFNLNESAPGAGDDHDPRD